MRKKFSNTILALFFLFSTHAQTFELGSGLFIYSATGNVLKGDAATGYKAERINDKMYKAPGASFHYYHPFFSKSSEVSLGLLTGISGFINYAPAATTIDSKLYGSNQLGHEAESARGLQVPLLLNLRLGRNATSNSTSALGIAIGGGIMANGFAYDNYYFDRFLNFPPVVNADLALGRVRFRLMYLLSPYKTYYIYDSGKKETKYNISQFSITANITLGDD